MYSLPSGNTATITKGKKMLNLTYTAEKNGSIVSVENRLMVSERVINDLLDTLVSAGFTILSTRIESAEYSQHLNG
jgi:hypothetical protein